MKTVIDAVNEFKGEWYGSEDKVYICDTGVITDYDQFNDLVSQMETNFGKCIPYAEYKTEYAHKEKVIIMLDELHKLIDEPQPTPIFTKEMADNGVLPSVGMECLVLNTNCSNPKYIKALIKYVGDLVIYAYVENGERCDNVKTLKFKPVTPHIELIDGKAYQFDFEGDINSFDSAIGIYDKTSTGAMWVKNKVMLVSQCTNIQPLTVEVK